MGADLIGYILKGPKVLPLELKLAALVKATEVIAKAKIYVENKEEDIPDGTFPVGLDIQFDLENVASLNPDEVVNDFIDAWAGDYRDFICREDPDNPSQLIVVAGELTWGDEPQGGAYEAIKWALCCGILDVFGVK